MTKRAKKEFTPGETVEVQRKPDAPWEAATYRKKYVDWRGYHSVRLAGVGRYIDKMTGTETTADHPNAFLIDTLSVPTRRIRARRTTRRRPDDDLTTTGRPDPGEPTTEETPHA